jgi:hypothetical protein
LYIDGHARARYGTRDMQKTHVARLKFPAPATRETWVTDARGDPVFMVIAEPSESLAGELRRLVPKQRQVVGEGRRVKGCFDPGGWPPALFADITDADFDILTYRNGQVPDLPDAAFTKATGTDDRGRPHDYDLTDTTVELAISDGLRKGETVTLRQVSRRVELRAPLQAPGSQDVQPIRSEPTRPLRSQIINQPLNKRFGGPLLQPWIRPLYVRNQRGAGTSPDQR